MMEVFLATYEGVFLFFFYCFMRHCVNHLLEYIVCLLSDAEEVVR